ncbi:hypothetical protein [Pseudodesulfovibrio sp. S3]|nr:hypothetical protein [Pseudodesulfovibrio sp. S3]
MIHIARFLQNIHAQLPGHRPIDRSPRAEARDTPPKPRKDTVNR